jgi:hypothetical protein
MNHYTDPTNGKVPGVSDDAKGLDTDTTNDLNFATGTRHSKAIATQVAELAIRGHAVHQLKEGGFLVCKYGHTFHAINFVELQAFARRLGVSQ